MYIHFIAIGGAIMHQLAIALHNKGHQVTGSDDEINDPAKSNLESKGILPQEEGWHPSRINSKIDAIVLGMHAKGDNPELKKAQELGLNIYSFPQYVYEVSKDKKRVVIAGSHGKTTITSMVMHILRYQGVDFDYLVGAKVEGFELSVKLTDAPIIILEGDEYPASVIEKRPKVFFYYPHITVLSGIAWDHINVFPTYDIYLNQFEQYLEGIEKGVPVFYNNEDEEVQKVIASSAQHLSTTPYNTPSYQYNNGKATVTANGNTYNVAVFGKHNLLNMQAAIAVCKELGIDEDSSYKAIATFKGAARRLEKMAEADSFVAFRDFAHAPSKLKATLDATREAYPNHQLIACFELHTFSSLSDEFLKEYAHSMDAADEAIVFFSHHAIALKGLPSISTEQVKAHFSRADLSAIDDKELLKNKVSKLLENKDRPTCLLLMSSGTFDGIDWNSVSSQFSN